MILRYSAILFFICLTCNLSGQDKQYVVKFNGDTLRGKLQINPVRDNTRTMYFKNDDGSKENIRPVRVTYVYYDEEYQFRSVPYYNQRLFMQIIKEDEQLSYYNYIHKRDNSISTTKVALRADGEAIELSALTFRKQVSEFLKDCPELVVRIDNKEFRYKDYEKLFAEYNDCDHQRLVTRSSQVNETSTGATAATATVVSGAVNNGTEANTETKNKLSKIDEFRKYVRGLGDFNQSRDVLEWLTDVEIRVVENRGIPNYLWSSLDEMSEDHNDLQLKARDLKLELQD